MLWRGGIAVIETQENDAALSLFRFYRLAAQVFQRSPKIHASMNGILRGKRKSFQVRSKKAQ